MPNYDFKSLSPYDFEILVRDLLQEELGVTLESFKAGRDGGIDLRYSRPANAELFVVQCKHFAESGYYKLYHHLNTEEVSKVQTLRPTRYIVATAVGLTPGNKDAIRQLFDPFCLSSSDVFGKDDLNNLLGKFKDIEKRNFKLWLTSQAVLDRIIHSAVFNQTEIDLLRIRERIKYYVQNASFSKTIDILEKEHYCIVTGIPGIGKTTLAEILLIDYIDRGYEAIRVSSDIREALAVFQPDKKQVFYYDDFLGQTGLENKLNKNEEMSLLGFLANISKYPGTRLILTTREYILNQAKGIYEKLATSRFDLFKCTIELESYTAFHRAQILFNHIYFSELDIDYKIAVLSGRNYMKIISHPNYNPRIIEWMTTYARYLNVDASQYLKAFIENLDNPFQLWTHAFENQISPTSRSLLVILTTLSSEVLLEDLEDAFYSFMMKGLGSPTFQNITFEFRKALKELEGNFVKTSKSGNDIIVQFHNPSIRDYLESHLSHDLAIVRAICSSAVFFEQITRLWGTPSSLFHVPATRPLLGLCRDELWIGIESTVDARSCNLVKSSSFGTTKKVRHSDSFEHRLWYILNIAEGLHIPRATEIIDVLFVRLCTKLAQKQAHKPDLLNSLQFIAGRSLPYAVSKDALFNLAREYILGDLRDLDDYRIVVSLASSIDDFFTPEELEGVSKIFDGFYLDDVESTLQYDDPQYLTDYMSTLQNVSQALKVDTESEVERLNERIVDLESRIWSEPDESIHNHSSGDHSDSDIHDMFAVLLDMSAKN